MFPVICLTDAGGKNVGGKIDLEEVALSLRHNTPRTKAEGGKRKCCGGW